MFCPIWTYFIYSRDILRAGELRKVSVHGWIYLLRLIFQVVYLSCMILERVNGEIFPGVSDVDFRPSFPFQRISKRK